MEETEAAAPAHGHTNDTPAGARLLEEAGIPEPRLTAEVLLAHATKRERTWLFGHAEEILDGITGVRYNGFLQDRTRGKPCQYIIGARSFMPRFRADPGCVHPRPETEYVVEQALKLVPRPGQSSMWAADRAPSPSLWVSRRARRSACGGRTFRPRRWLWRAETPSGSARGSAL